jgi:hypothetical protein
VSKEKESEDGENDYTRVHSTCAVVSEKEGKSAVSTSLNEKVVESFWHKDFDFRR